MVEMIVIEIAGPPTHTPVFDGMFRLPFRLVLGLWAHTRQWKRQERAGDLDRAARQLSLTAAIHRAKDMGDFNHALRNMHMEAQALRLPESVPTLEETMTEEDLLFLRGPKE